MPVNATSTGATYGKSSDPLCPLGFHPQVRWPTRCKRCFRDYKEHLDAADRAKFANTDSGNTDAWTSANGGRRPGFNKSKSLDVTASSAAAPASVQGQEASGPQQPSQYGRFFEPPKARTPLPNEFQGIPKVMEMTSQNSSFRSQSLQPEKRDDRGRSKTPNVTSFQEEISKLQEEVKSLQSQNEELKKEQYKYPVSYDKVKASETASELTKAKEKINDQDMTIRALEKEKSILTVKMKDMEETFEKRNQLPRLSKNHSEMEAKLKFLEKKCKALEAENDKLQSNVQNLEGELEEVQDNFREDEADEYRNLKRDLENTSKNCRVLQFKLKKAEKSLSETIAEKTDLETRMKDMTKGGVNLLDSINKIKALEKELEQKKELNSKYESQLSDLRFNKTNANFRGPCLSRTGSTDKAVEDQLIKDLQDSIERENDLKEQMTMAEEETAELRIKVSRLEDENESILQQLKKMSSKNKRRTPSPGNEKGDDARDDMSVAELTLQLDISEQEVGVLRKKVDSVLADNLRLSKQVKDVGHQMNQLKKKPASSSSGWRSLSGNEGHDSQLEELQTDLNNTRIKLIEKERECEQLSSQLRSQKLGKSSTFRREGNQQKQLEVIENEASILRRRNSDLEALNEQLKNECKQLQTKGGKKLPSSSMEKLKMDKFSLEEKVSNLQRDVKEKDILIATLKAASNQPTNTSESKNMKKENNALALENESLKGSQAADREMIKKLRDDMITSSDRENSLRKTIEKLTFDKSLLEKDLQKFTSDLANSETKQKVMRTQIEDQKKAMEDLKQKSASHLHQTQKGVVTFKEQIDSLKRELQEEKAKTKKSARASRDAEHLESRVKDLEEKWAKSKRINQQRKDKIETLERQLEEKKLNSDFGEKLKQSEKTVANQRKRIQDLERQLWKEDKDDSWDELQKEYDELKKDHSTIQSELSTLRHTYNIKADAWIKEKLDIQKKMKDLEDSFLKTAGEGWSTERERFKHIIEDRDNQITQLKIEADVARSQTSTLKKECDELKVKLQDYEKMSKFQKVVSNDDDETHNLKTQISDLQKQLSSEKKDKKSELNLVKLKHDSKIAVMAEEIGVLKSQCSKYRRERETYKEMVEGVQKNRSNHQGSEKAQITDLQFQIQVLEDEVAEAKLETSKSNANAISVKADYEIEIAELKSKINELKEEELIESGRARIAGTRTKMELAWQKEREGQKRLITELNTMCRDLKATLLDNEKEIQREKIENKRKSEAAKTAFDEEHEDMKKQISDLQYDLLELRDAHTKLRSTNEKLRREKDRAEKDREEMRSMIKEKSRSEQGEEKKIARLLADIDQFCLNAKKSIDSGRSGQASLGTHLIKLQESKEELEQFRRLAEEERNAKRAILLRRGESAETECEDSPMRSRTLRSNATSQQRRYAYRKTASVGDGAGESAWRSQESITGSSNSLASNSSIPLPIPVRTRSSQGGSESGYSSDFNALNIRRLERDTSLDRISTGSRESGRSTQSELIRGERKSRSKAGLIGKLKKLTRGLSSERDREFGSGSDVSSISVTSSSRHGSQHSSSITTMKSSTAVAATSSTDPKSGSRSLGSKANQPYDKYFDKSNKFSRSRYQ